MTYDGELAIILECVMLVRMSAHIGVTGKHVSNTEQGFTLIEFLVV